MLWKVTTLREIEYTLDDLTALTGFSRRQIRYYITRKLVPGAGRRRGPDARYSEDALHRLRAIAMLKEIRVAPTGRAMTLGEIRHTLEILPPEGANALIKSTVNLKIQFRENRQPPWQAGREPFNPDLDRLLCRLQSLLDELGADSRFAPAGNREQWTKVVTSEVEIQIRQPDSLQAKRRLAAMAAALARLIAGAITPARPAPGTEAARTPAAVT